MGYGPGGAYCHGVGYGPTTPEQIDRHLSKHYLPAITVVGGNYYRDYTWKSLPNSNLNGSCTLLNATVLQHNVSFCPKQNLQTSKTAAHSQPIFSFAKLCRAQKSK